MYNIIKTLKLLFVKIVEFFLNIQNINKNLFGKNEENLINNIVN